MSTTAIAPGTKSGGTVVRILAAISVCHLLNDMVQSLIPAVYPVLKSSYHLDFSQIGLITLTYQLVASLLQPVIGLYTDHRPKPYSLVAGMGCTLVGLVLFSMASGFGPLLFAVAMVGLGSAVFHPESSRVARMASGGQHGLAQSVFQVGGNAGSATGPLLAAFVVIPRGQHSIAWFSLVALFAMILLSRVGAWYKSSRSNAARSHVSVIESRRPLTAGKTAVTMGILGALIFSKYFYLSSLVSYYTFYLMGKFHLSAQSAEMRLFVFLGAVAAGTIIGGPVGDRIGRKYVIWCSILGVLPFTLALPYANLFWTGVLSVVIGLILASAFSAILVYAQELIPGKVGMISGLFFGLAFGMAGVGAALLGRLADSTSISLVYRVCSFLPAIGLLTAFLPQLERRKSGVRESGSLGVREVPRLTSHPPRAFKTLASNKRMHGYAITAHFQRVSSDLLRVEERSLYPALHRLEQQGLVRAEWGTTKKNREARYYSPTSAARKELVREQESWARLKGICHGSAGRPQIKMACPSVPSVGRILLDEGSQPEPMRVARHADCLLGGIRDYRCVGRMRRSIRNAELFRESPAARGRTAWRWELLGTNPEAVSDSRLRSRSPGLYRRPDSRRGLRESAVGDALRCGSVGPGDTRGRGCHHACRRSGSFFGPGERCGAAGADAGPPGRVKTGYRLDLYHPARPPGPVCFN